MVAIALFLPALIGFIVVNLLFGNDREIGLPERLSLAYPLGMGLISVQLFLLGIARVPLQLSWVASLALLETAALSIWLYLSDSSIPSWSGCLANPSGSPSRSRAIRLGEAVLLAWICLKIGSVLLETGLRPIFSFDTFINWSMRAKVFYYSNSLLLNPDAYDFFGRGVGNSLANFPPHNPLAQLWMALWIGSFDEVLVKCWTPLYLVSAVMYLYILAAREVGRLMSLVITVLFISSPIVALHATETMSDLPLAVYILFAVGSLLNVIRRRRSYLPFLGIFSALAMFMKAEGLFIALPLFISCAWAISTDVRNGRYALKSVAAPLLLPYICIVPWFMFKLVYRLGLGPDGSSTALTFLPLIFAEYLGDLVVLGNFNVIYIFIPLMLLSYGRLDRELAHLLIPLSCYALFFLLLYVFINYYAPFANGYSANVFRNAMTYYPSACLITALLIRRLRTDAQNDH